MEYNHNHLQEKKKYALQEKLIGLRYLSLNPKVIERIIENPHHKNSHNHKHD